MPNWVWQKKEFAANNCLARHFHINPTYPALDHYRKTKNTQGGVLGITADDCYRELERQEYEDENTGTVFGELLDIENENKKIASSFKRWYVNIHNAWLYIIDFSFPVLFGLYSTYLLYIYIYIFLSSGNV